MGLPDLTQMFFPAGVHLVARLRLRTCRALPEVKSSPQLLTTILAQLYQRGRQPKLRDYRKFLSGVL